MVTVSLQQLRFSVSLHLFFFLHKKQQLFSKTFKAFSNWRLMQ